MPEGLDTTIEVCNIMSFVLYTQNLKQSVLKPASPGITLIQIAYLYNQGLDQHAFNTFVVFCSLMEKSKNVRLTLVLQIPKL